MQRTRARILNYLESNHFVSAGDLARFLDMTPANIRYHLDKLKDAGEIQISGTRPAGGSGRPIYLYNLSSRSLGENTETLLKVLLDVIDAQHNSSVIIENLVDHISRDHLSEKMTGIERLNQGIELLNKMNYHASWQASPDGPQIEFRHCPYRDLAVQDNRLCQIDERLISEIVKDPMELVQKRTFGDNPYSPCLFVLKKEPAPGS